MVFYRWLSIFCLALLAPTAPVAAAAADANSAATVWTARGGELAFIWNRSLLRDLDIRVSVQAGVGAADREGFQPVAVEARNGLRFVLDRAAFGQFVGGSATLNAGFVLHLPDGDISLAGATLQPRASDARTLELRDAQGRSWFYLDHMMLDIAEDGRSLLVHTMDLRATPALAQRVGRPFAADWSLAQLRFNSPLLAQDGRYIERVLGGPIWPGTELSPGQTYQADVFMRANTAQIMRCATSPTCSGNCSCDGPAAATDGYLVVAPNATLRNNTNDGSAVATVPGDPNGTSTVLHAADIPWYRKFSGSRPPYDNDQHPLLIWNLYRIDSAGRIEQVGRSAVKHAFVSTNTNCTPGPGSNNSTGAVLGLGCSDTYSTGNNDGIQNLGPRSEIVPAKALWGRCGSTADPDCNLVENGISGNDYEQRMVVRESQIPTGSSYYMESWYVVRDDVNIYNTMASWPVTFNYSGSGPWSVSNGSPWALGPAINLWVNPATTSAFQKNSEISTGEGHARVAVKVTSLGGNQWRYDYAVMNFDFARAVTTGTPAYSDDSTAAQRFRVVHNFGFDRFSIPLPAGGTATQTFHDGDLDSSNDWSTGTVGDAANWTALADLAPPPGVPAVRNPLNWGTLFRFSLTSDQPPVEGLAQLHVAQAGDPEWLSAATLVPQAVVDLIFVDNFEE